MNGRLWAALIVAGWVWILLQASFYGDPDDWFVVSEIHVDDVEIGQEPVVRYERWIKQKFLGNWTVELNEVTPGGFMVACSGSGSNNYKPTDRKPIDATLSYFIGKICPIEAGKAYSIDVIWTIRPHGVPPMEVERTSNEFRVGAAPERP